MGLLSHLSDRTTKINVHHGDTVIVRQPRTDPRQNSWIVVPNLHCQRARFVAYPPLPLWWFCLMFIEPGKAASTNHFSRLQANPTVTPHDLTKCVVGEPSHRRLEYRWIDDDGADA